MLTLGLPSKGRLKEQAEAYFEKIGLSVVTRGQREYVGHLKGVDVKILFLQVSDITKRLVEGTLDLGITGIDVLSEYQGDAPPAVHCIRKLGFGEARLVVAVPQSWIDVETMADLDEVAHQFRQRTGRRMRVATKYFYLTNRFFRSHSISDYRLVDSSGATELAPYIDAAELITDITTTGATLSANHLKTLLDGEILSSEALLGMRMKGSWSPEALDSLRCIIDFIVAYEQAGTVSLVRASDVGTQILSLLEAEGAGDVIYAQGGVSFTYPSAKIYSLVRKLEAQGVGSVTVTRPRQVYTSHNALWKSIEQIIDY